jgi:hypothetical protein
MLREGRGTYDEEIGILESKFVHLPVVACKHGGGAAPAVGGDVSAIDEGDGEESGGEVRREDLLRVMLCNADTTLRIAVAMLSLCRAILCDAVTELLMLWSCVMLGVGMYPRGCVELHYLRHGCGMCETEVPCILHHHRLTLALQRTYWRV